ncbi:hypothetical protein PTKIN_Ptkin02bG0174400 [Pterospermum kingtungense]
MPYVSGLVLKGGFGHFGSSTVRLTDRRGRLELDFLKDKRPPGWFRWRPSPMVKSMRELYLRGVWVHLPFSHADVLMSLRRYLLTSSALKVPCKSVRRMSVFETSELVLLSFCIHGLVS